jgi:hypothetical protein
MISKSSQEIINKMSGKPMGMPEKEEKKKRVVDATPQHLPKPTKNLPVKKEVVKKELPKKKEIDKQVFEINFPVIHTSETTKYDLNYVAIRRKIIGIGQYAGLIKTKKKFLEVE